MDIKVYLPELIATQKTVGINGLGTLFRKKIPGRYDLETHSFLPPKQEISFTPEFNEDTMLATFISEKNSISVESANSYINEFVEHVHSQLADHQHADFSPLGELKRIDNEIIFEPSKTFDFNFDFYGLPSVSAKIDDNQAAEQVDLKEESKPVEDEEEEKVDIETDSKETSENKGPLITDPLWKATVIHRYEYDDDDEENEYAGRWKAKLLKFFLALIMAGAILAIILYYFYPDLFYTIKGNFFDPTVKTVPYIKPDSSEVATNIDSNLTDSTKKTLVLPATVKDSAIIEPINNTIYYEVIGGAMKTQRKADEIISTLSKRGINAKKVDAMPGRRIKISLGTFTDFNLAKKFQDSLKIKLRNPEIYIQTIKPKN